jgi:hypothetical protein
LKRLYNEGRLTKEGIDNAVVRGWISADEAAEIVGSTVE